MAANLDQSSDQTSVITPRIQACSDLGNTFPSSSLAEITEITPGIEVVSDPSAAGHSLESRYDGIDDSHSLESRYDGIDDSRALRVGCGERHPAGTVASVASVDDGISATSLVVERKSDKEDGAEGILKYSENGRKRKRGVIEVKEAASATSSVCSWSSCEVWYRCVERYWVF